MLRRPRHRLPEPVPTEGLNQDLDEDFIVALERRTTVTCRTDDDHTGGLVTVLGSEPPNHHQDDEPPPVPRWRRTKTSR